MFERKKRKMVSLIAAGERARAGEASASSPTPAAAGVADREVRWFDAPGSPGTHNVSAGYKERAIDLIERKIESLRYFLFSDIRQP